MVLSYSSGNFIQYLAVNSNGKEYKMEYIYIYIYMNHFGIHQELTQHFQSTILQLKQ